ncbi:MAG: SDR family oxidoreductase [Aristaeellaceae bacterium]
MTVWVTGASSGLGLHTARALRDAGHTVIAGARSFRMAKQDGMHCLPLDVTDEDSIEAFRRTALRLSPRVDALVHCAGMLVLGSCEETSPEEYHRVMNTNFLGMVRMNQAALPLMRAQGQGRIVLFSSINGLMGIPFQSAYTASKHAVEGYAECLAMEVKPFGIQVCLVEPGDHRSGSQRYRLQASAMGADSPYAQDFARGIAAIHRDEANGSDPDRLGCRVAALLQKKRMPLRACIASIDQWGAAMLHRLLPGRCMNTLIRCYYLGKPRKDEP